jgi:hypothetical protein
MQVTGVIGNAAKTADGNGPVLRQGNLGELMVSELHGAYYEQAMRGNMFHVASQAAVTTTAALATTWTGLAISNPAGSGVNAVINLFSVAQFAVGAAAAIGIMTGAGTAAGSLVPRNCLIGGPTGRVTASAGATIATPVLDIVVGQAGSLATTGYGVTPGLVVDLKGSLIIPPGFFAASFTSIVTTTALLFGFQWEEVPI